jgi:hypothetical protein
MPKPYWFVHSLVHALCQAQLPQCTRRAFIALLSCTLQHVLCASKIRR